MIHRSMHYTTLLQEDFNRISELLRILPEPLVEPLTEGRSSYGTEGQEMMVELQAIHDETNFHFQPGVLPRAAEEALKEVADKHGLINKQEKEDT